MRENESKGDRVLTSVVSQGGSYCSIQSTSGRSNPRAATSRDKYRRKGDTRSLKYSVDE